MRSSIAFRVVLAGLLCIVLAGCVTARSLAPLAEQNQLNLSELRQNVGASTRLSEIFIDSAMRTYLFNRLSQVYNDFTAVLKAVDEPLPSEDWAQLLKTTRHKEQFDILKAELVVCNYYFPFRSRNNLFRRKA